MRGFITPDRAYYEGDRAHPLDLEVPQRPTPDHIWSGAAWALDPARYQQTLEAAVQSHLDSRAAERGYSGILSATSYATSNHPRFGAEGRAYAAWRDAVWDYCYQELAAVQQGLRAIPTVEALIAELPALVLP